MESQFKYELTAEQLGFLFRIRHDSGKPFDVHVTMKPYGNREMIQLLKERAGHMQQAKDDYDAWDVKEGNTLIGREFFDKHAIKVKLNGVTLSDPQFEKLDARWNVREVTIEQGYNGIYRATTEPEDEFRVVDVEEILGDAAIRTKFMMTDAEEKEHVILINHLFDYPNAMDSLSWDRAQIQQGLRQGGWRVQYNHESLNSLYGKKIQSLEGVTLDGQPCAKENKDEWVDAVPYLMKRAALNFLFSRAERATRGN